MPLRGRSCTAPSHYSAVGGKCSLSSPAL